MIKALLFDLGGVLIRVGDFAPVSHWAARLGISIATIVERGSGHPAAHAAIIGELSAGDCWRMVAALGSLSDF